MNTYRHVREMLGHGDSGISYEGERITKRISDQVCVSIPRQTNVSVVAIRVDDEDGHRD
jgi:hypothetical protein